MPPEQLPGEQPMTGGSTPPAPGRSLQRNTASQSFGGQQTVPTSTRKVEPDEVPNITPPQPYSGMPPAPATAAPQQVNPLWLLAGLLAFYYIAKK